MGVISTPGVSGHRQSQRTRGGEGSVPRQTEASGETNPADTLTSDFQPPEPRENKFLFQATQSVALAN